MPQQGAALAADLRVGGPERRREMMRRMSVGSLCALLIALPSQVARAAAEPVITVVDRQAVEAWLNTYSASINKGDADAFGRLWADSADWAPPDAPLLSGHDAILGYARGMLDKYTVSHRFTAQSFRLGEGFGVAVIAAAERYTPKASSGAPWEQNVKGVIILRREDDGLWRGTHFIWNRDAAGTH
jgi:uncharacterized protein (TIGR02246 family)